MVPRPLSRRPRRPLPAVAALLAGVASAVAIPPTTRPADASPPNASPSYASPFDPARHMHTSEVRPGMTGYGLSVFSGTKIERFDVEVISVMRNQVGPGHDIVLIRCRGQGLEHSGAIEGMSGSPIFLADSAGKSRMIGAFALGWENSKDPIAGVRPIEEMLRVPTDPRPVAAKPAVVAGLTWNAIPLLSASRTKATNVAADVSSNDGSRLTRLSLPLTVAGVSDAAFARVAPALRQTGLVPLQGGAVAAADADLSAKLEPGAAIGLPIVTGDLDVSALGTVTEVIGDKIYAFGHEFNAEGAVDLPMGLGYVHTIIPASTISFKIGTLLRLDGAIHNDESTAIAGTIGPVPAMIPVTVSVRTAQRPDEKTYHFQIARHPKFTPTGAVTAVTSAIMGDSALPSEFTVKYAMKLTFEHGQVLNLADVATSATEGEQLKRDLNLPLTLALENPFGRAYPTSISARFEVTPVATLDELKSVTAERQVYKPGESVGLFVTTQAHEGNEATRRVAFDLPEDLAEGDYTLTVGDADRALADATRDAPYRYQARNLDEVFDLIREVTQRPSQRLYLRLASRGQGVSIGRTPLMGLPASRVRVLGRSGSADVLPFVPALTRAVAWASPLKGSTDVELRVSRTPEKTPRPSNDVMLPPEAAAEMPATPKTPGGSK